VLIRSPIISIPRPPALLGCLGKVRHLYRKTLLPWDKTPSPSKGEGWGEGEKNQLIQDIVSPSPLSPPAGGGDGWVFTIPSNLGSNRWLYLAPLFGATPRGEVDQGEVRWQGTREEADNDGPGGRR